MNPSYPTPWLTETPSSGKFYPSTFNHGYIPGRVPHDPVQPAPAVGKALPVHSLTGIAYLGEDCVTRMTRIMLLGTALGTGTALILFFAGLTMP